MSVACKPVRWSRTKLIYDAYPLAALHAKSVVDWYFAFAPVSRIETLFTLNTSFGQIIGFPFGLFGLFALVVLVVMAATRHDFWLCFLTPRF